MKSWRGYLFLEEKDYSMLSERFPGIEKELSAA
jgi:hypothetical protein